MSDENDFNFSSENSFKKSKTKYQNSGSFGRTVFVPFLSGIIGAA